MFYVYDLDGLRFKGPLEQLERERKVERRAPVPPLESGGRRTPFGKGPEYTAVTAYLNATKKENMIEPLVHIYQIMSSPVDTITADRLLLDAWGELDRKGISQMVVVSDRMAVTGLLSDKDILRRINIVDDEIVVEPGLTVGDVMQKEVITTDYMSDIRRVARVMAYYHVASMPVIGSNDTLSGIVTRGDILRGFAENRKLNLWA
ncbi:HPP family protein [Desulfosediminicola flagellatus]|uniref:CBS domain-containing protein n=1 Tax=Desulfosediminicola flagellatus TaxID=2569541 RepID=UPI0010ABA47D|nr:CBS domain-containing protein [Desulfosediminicola flagellatus]